MILRVWSLVVVRFLSPSLPFSISDLGKETSLSINPKGFPDQAIPVRKVESPRGE
ncbi:hypothetical protein I3760_01G118100 [Carya illinoinensis]|nr:hypothetical protein I3760_01G118100 [Carya illinoinensis]